MSVLFTSVRPLERAENLKAVYDAYDGEKQYVQRRDDRPVPGIHSGRFRAVVTDGLINESPGKYIWIGHGMGAGKHVGCQHPVVPFLHSDLITYAIAGSVETVPIVARYLGVPESKVIPLGMPRTDAYFRLKKESSDVKQHLYAPTFRKGHWMPDLNKVWRLLPEGHRFTVKLHPNTGNTVTSMWKNIEVASAWEPSTPYLVNADTVVTDYSSIMFDAMLLRKPVILFAKDKDYYLERRGMYMPYPDKYSRYFCSKEEELVRYLLEAEWGDYEEKLRSFYAGACDGHSTERTLELIRSVI